MNRSIYYLEKINITKKEKKTIKKTTEITICVVMSVTRNNNQNILNS